MICINVVQLTVVLLKHFAESYSPSRAIFQVVQFGKVGCGSTMRTHDGYDAQDSYERARDVMGENVRVGNDDIESNGRRHRQILQPP